MLSQIVLIPLIELPVKVNLNPRQYRQFEDYFKAAQVRRQFAVDQVRESLGMSRAR